MYFSKIKVNIVTSVIIHHFVMLMNINCFVVHFCGLNNEFYAVLL